MRSAVLILTIAISLGVARADTPKAGSFGLGVMVGTGNSVVGKYWLLDQGSLDLGIEFTGHFGSAVYSNFFWQDAGLLGKGSRFTRESIVYFGGGLGAGFWDRTENCGRWHCHWNPDSTGAGNGFFVRGLVGLEWYPAHTKYGVFGELAPSYMWYPDSGGTVDFTVGGRYYF